jgi:hypothetical protein
MKDEGWTRKDEVGSDLRFRVPVYRLPSTVYRLPSTVYRLPSTVYRLPSTVYLLPSIFCLLSSALNDPSFGVAARLAQIVRLVRRNDVRINGYVDRGVAF